MCKGIKILRIGFEVLWVWVNSIIRNDIFFICFDCIYRSVFRFLHVYRNKNNLKRVCYEFPNELGTKKLVENTLLTESIFYPLHKHKRSTLPKLCCYLVRPGFHSNHSKSWCWQISFKAGRIVFISYELAMPQKRFKTWLTRVVSQLFVEHFQMQNYTILYNRSFTVAIFSLT